MAATDAGGEQSEQSENQSGQHQQGFRQHDVSASAQREDQGISLAQIDGIGAQGGELHQYGAVPAPGKRAGPGQGEHVGQEKVTVVHIGQQEGHSDGHDRRRGQKGRFVRCFPAPPEQRQQSQRQQQRRGDPQLGAQRLVDLGVIGQKRENRGGVVAQALIPPGVWPK